MKKYLTIHGHFYQPPRENPWTETIEKQPSAHPEHDWNEKINAECYFPNGCSRILDESGRIATIVSNYKYINFNFGPTLLSWLEAHAEGVYKRILDADKASTALFSGHGTAIAQCYNHIIMPLAHERDQRTQIKWGLADFRKRFGREPESIWLPETAINQKTLNILTEFPLKYIILSPFQAQAVRPFTNPNEVRDVGDGNIDTRRAYRCFAQSDSGEKLKDRYLDIFFYNPDLAKGISFDHLLQNATYLSEKIDSSFGEGEGNLLVHSATDGETFGHHQQFGDMALAYMLHVEAVAKQITPVTYGAFLAENPPQHEVELKAGPNNEGTAWSCAHGVGRWYRNCGCSTGGEYHWDQEWRQPLRRALDGLMEHTFKVAEEYGNSIFTDILAARDAYIDVILDRSQESVSRFLDAHATGELEEHQRVIALEIMEMLRQGQLMYTSCGWFFNELSGIETIQILKYAARAIQLADRISKTSYEEIFCAELKNAKSNLEDHGDGAQIYATLIKPTIMTLEKVVNHFAVYSIFCSFDPGASDHSFYIYNVKQIERTLVYREEEYLLVGMVSVQSNFTLRKGIFAYTFIYPNSGDELCCFVKEVDADFDYDAVKDNISRVFEQDHKAIKPLLQQIFGDETYSLADIFSDERQEIADKILKEKLATIQMDYGKIYRDNESLVEALGKLKLELPEEILIPAKFTLGKTIVDKVNGLGGSTNLVHYKAAFAAARTAERLGIKLEIAEASIVHQGVIERHFLKMLQLFSSVRTSELDNLLEISTRLKLKLHHTPIQNRIHDLLQQRVEPIIEDLIAGKSSPDLHRAIKSILSIAHRFGFNIESYESRLEIYEAQKRNKSVAGQR